MINLNFSDHRPLYEQIKDKIRMLIISGAVEENQQIPSVRELAQNLAINPNTIQRAYKELETEGYINSVRGKGNFVAHKAESISSKRYDELCNELKATLRELRFIGTTEHELNQIISKFYSEGENQND